MDYERLCVPSTSEYLKWSGRRAGPLLPTPAPSGTPRRGKFSRRCAHPPASQTPQLIGSTSATTSPRSLPRSGHATVLKQLPPVSGNRPRQHTLIHLGDPQGSRLYYTMEESSPQIAVNRRVLTQNDLCEVPETKKRSDFVGRFRRDCDPKAIVKSVIPAIGWLSEYNWKEWLIKDAISGFTVAVMNIPQGMAYALLGNVPPVVGIYMAFFPVIVYAFLGTSRHVSMGSFAVICLMTGNVISKHVMSQEGTAAFTVMEVATAVTFLVGIYQMVLYILRLGIVCTLLSDTLVSGFTAAAAVHVFTSQVKDLLGITLPHYSGPFKLIYVYKSIFENLYTANSAALIISAITVVVLLINNEIIKPRVARRTKFPIPIELAVVLCGTLVSYYGNIAEEYGLSTVGPIPTGLLVYFWVCYGGIMDGLSIKSALSRSLWVPAPVLPNFKLMPSIAIESAVIAVIAYIVSLSMGLIFANKLKYQIDSNQELLAQGAGNLVGSLFSCMPFAASLSRSVVQQTVGGMTQLASLISSALLLVVLLWIGPFFEPLPRCVLAGLIVVALKGILLQALDIMEIWRASRLDGLIWITTYVTVIVVEIEYGLLAGIVVSILILIVRGVQSRVQTLERIPQTELYVELDRFAKTEAIPGVSIVKYSGCLNFVNRAFFKTKIVDLVGEREEVVSNSQSQEILTQRLQDTVILDMQCLTYMDPSGAECLKTLIIELAQNNRTLYLAGIPGDAVEVLRICKVIADTGVRIFPSVHDAVVFAQSRQAGVYTVRL